MRQYDSDEVYEYSVDGVDYSFWYPNPVTRNGGRSFDGVAEVWKKSEPRSNYFTVPFHVRADEIDQAFDRIYKGIEKYVRGLETTE